MLKKINNHRIITIGCFLISIFYALFLSSFNLLLFKDIDNYLSYINTLEYRKDLILSNGIFFFEPVFFIICKGLNSFLKPEEIIRVIIFFNSFTIFYKCSTSFRRGYLNILLLTLCLFQSQVFALQLVTLRQGIGLSILIWIFPYLKNNFRLSLSLTFLGLIHNSFFIIAFFTFAYELINRIGIERYKIKISLMLCIGIMFNLSIFVLLRYFSTKQGGHYDGISIQTSGGGFLLWVTIFLYILSNKKNMVRLKNYALIYDFVLLGLIIYLSSYFLTPIAGRIIGTFIPFIYFIILSKTNAYDILFVCFLIIVNVYLFFNGGAEAFMKEGLPDLWNDISNNLL